MTKGAAIMAISLMGGCTPVPRASELEMGQTGAPQTVGLLAPFCIVWCRAEMHTGTTGRDDEDTSDITIRPRG